MPPNGFYWLHDFDDAPYELNVVEVIDGQIWFCGLGVAARLDFWPDNNESIVINGALIGPIRPN